MADKKGNEAKKPNVHVGHRQRMKNRFLKYGDDSFDDYQMLEILLFYAIPTKDTNELAHILINTFGSLKKVCQADYNDLLSVSGVGENVASLLKFLPLIAKRYISSTFSSDGLIMLNSVEKMREYCESLYVGEDSREVLYVLALNSDLSLAGQLRLNKGIVSKVEVPMREMVEFIIKCNCDRAVITHNHPTGTFLASKADIEATNAIAEALCSIGIELVDHIIVCKGMSNSMRENHVANGAWELYDRLV